MKREEKWLLDEKYHGKPTAKFHEDVKRLGDGEPLDYIIGFTEFLGCKIDVSKKPLIPRFETEFWVEQVIEDMIASGKEIRVLDIFRGRGAQGISIMRQVPKSFVVLSDSEKNCIEQIEINCNINTINKRQYQVIQSDIFENIQEKFDYIVANPPYIPLKDKHKVQVSALNHEPHMALFGEDDGLFYIRRFLKDAQSHLLKGGKIYMEFDTEQRSEIIKILKENAYKQYEFKKDQYNRIRYLVVEN